MTATNRLHNMEVEEISLVNVPANKRKFLVVKHLDGTSENLELVRQEGGGITLVSKGEEELPDDQSPAGLDGLKLSKEDKEALLTGAAGALERLTSLTKALDDAEEEDGASVPDVVLQEIDAVGDLLGKAKPPKWKCSKADCGYAGVPAKGGKCPKCGAKMELVKQDGEEPDEEDEEEQGKKKGEDPASKADGKKKKPEEDEESMEKLLEHAATPEGREKLGKAMDSHAKLLEEKLEAIMILAKGIAEGAKDMDPKDLREKLRQLEGLGWKLGEVAEVVNVGKAAAPESDLAKARLAGFNEAVELLGKVAPVGAPTDDQRINGGAGEHPPGTDPPPMSFEELMGKVPGLAEIAKRVEEMEKKIGGGGRSDVRKSVPAPRSAQPESRRTQVTKTTWPLDMNNERDD